MRGSEQRYPQAHDPRAVHHLFQRDVEVVHSNFALMRKVVEVLEEVEGASRAGRVGARGEQAMSK